MKQAMWIVLASVIPPVAIAGDPAHTVSQPCLWRETFAGTGLSQFASYPPVQDVGYDPSLVPTTQYGAPGGHALMRILNPVRSGPERFGFIRRLDLQASSGAAFSFCYRLTGASSDDSLELGVAAANGKRYTRTIPAGTADAWHRANAALAEFRDASGRPLPVGTGVDGVYLVAHLKRADPDVTYRFLIADLQIKAAQEARFRMLRPAAIALEPRRELFATASLEVNKPLGVEAASPIRLTKVECVLADRDGKSVARASLYDDATHGDRAAHDGVWTNEAVAGAVDRSGVYRLRLSGATAADGQLATTVRLVRPSAAPQSHPRLYFGAPGRAMLAERARDPKYAAAWRDIVQQAKSSRTSGDLSRGTGIFPMLDRIYLLPTLPGYFDLITHAGSRIQYNALVAYVTGDRQALEAAKGALLAIMQWKSWAPPWFPEHGQATYYPVGELTARVAFAYDLLYDKLTPGDREIIRRGLVGKGIAPAYEEYAVDDRVLANTSNWIAHSVAGSLIAAAAIRGDDAIPNVDLYTNGLLAKLEAHLGASFLPGGAYGESISYYEFNLETLAPALIALQRVFGLDYWSRSHVKDSLWYPVSTLADPVSGCLDMGDTHCPSGRTTAPVVAASQNPVFRWFQDHFPPASIESFLFSDDKVEAKPPEAPGSRYFPAKGAVVFRTGWQPNSAILLFRAGPNFNHNHADQGSFLFRALGENFATDSGYADYYKDPYYDTYFKQAAGHNTVLIDGDPASQQIADTLAFPALHKFPRITNVITSVGFDAVTSELQQVYRGRLKRYTRSIAFIKPDCVLVYDELDPKERETFDWLLHLPDKSRVEVESGHALYHGRSASLAVRFFSPASPKLSVSDGHLPYSVFNPVAPADVPAEPAILNARSAPSAQTVRFLTALAPAHSGEEARRGVDALRHVDSAAWSGVKREGELLLFRKGASGPVQQFEGWTTDAEVWFVRGSAENPQLVAGLGATVLKRGSEVWFASGRPASFTASYENGHTILSVYSSVAQTVRLRRPGGEMQQIQAGPGERKFEFTWESKP